MKPRRFDVGQAEEILPQLASNVRRLQHLRCEMTMVQGSRESLHEIVEATNEEGMFYCARKEIGLSKRYHKLAHEFFIRIEDVMRLGVILHDIDEGVVDFPHKIQGRDVLLCWHVGEKDVVHWHEVHENHDERKRIVDLDKELDGR